MTFHWITYQGVDVTWIVIVCLFIGWGIGLFCGIPDEHRVQD